MTGMRYPKILKPSAGGDASAEMPLSFTKLARIDFVGLPQPSASAAIFWRAGRSSDTPASGTSPTVLLQTPHLHASLSPTRRISGVTSCVAVCGRQIAASAKTRKLFCTSTYCLDDDPTTSVRAYCSLHLARNQADHRADQTAPRSRSRSRRPAGIRRPESRPCSILRRPQSSDTDPRSAGARSPLRTSAGCSLYKRAARAPACLTCFPFCDTSILACRQT